ncbi:MAG: HEAT repeat domain-containing protein [Treponema sp.]
MKTTIKRIFLLAACVFSLGSALLYSDDGEEAEGGDGTFTPWEVSIPAAKRPQSPDAQKAEEARRQDDDEETFEKNVNTLNFGTPAEIGKLIDDIGENEDPRYDDALYDLFQGASNGSIKEKIIAYFTKRKDPCLEDYAVTVLDDPYDSPNSLAEKLLNYVSAVECKEAAPALVNLLENGEERYFNGALAALGKTGGAKEAEYLAAYLERDDLTVPQRQALMRTLGEMAAVETFDAVLEIARDEDENSFVRMYAAEAVGKMKKDEAVPVLLNLLENGDANMRQYCVKGLSYFPSDSDATAAIVQAIRDDHYKVRLEAMDAAEKMNLTEAVGFIIYRARHDAEKPVKSAAYAILARMNTGDAAAFLTERLTDKKTGDGVKAEIAKNMMKEGSGGESEIIALAKEALKEAKHKQLKNELGKLFIKYPHPSYGEVCSLYLTAKDSETVSLGLEMFKTGKYDEARSFVDAIAHDKKAKDSNRKRAAKLLGLEEE